MKIESYAEQTHNDTAEDEALSGEVLLLIESLGLEGQTKITNAQGHVLPYRRMTEKEKRVFEALFPNKSKLKDYKASSIPLRILKHAEEADTHLPLDKQYIWYPRLGDTDPLLIGHKANDTYCNDPYLIARWGEALETFEALLIKATARLRSKLKKELIKAEDELQRAKRLISDTEIEIEELPASIYCSC